MRSLSTLLRLRDSSRQSLLLSPDNDADLLIDIDGHASTSESWLNDKAPKGVVHGDYGTGKSHLLRHIEKRLAPPRGFRPVYVELAGFGRKATFFDLHLRVMNSLLPIIENLAPRTASAGLVSKTTLVGDDVKRAITMLGEDSLKPPMRALTRSWLLGTGPTATQARNAGFSGRLFESSSAVHLVKLWRLCSELQRSTDKRTLLLLIDEGEGLQKVVHPDSLATLYAGVRSLVDPDNDSIGCIFALNTPEAREHPFLRSDVSSRMTGRVIALKPLGTPDRVMNFTTALWTKLSTDPEFLTAEALRELSRRLLALRNAISFEARPVTPTQRDLLSVLSFLAQQALREQKPPPYSIEDLTRWIPGGFVAP